MQNEFKVPKTMASLSSTADGKCMPCVNVKICRGIENDEPAVQVTAKTVLRASLARCAHHTSTCDDKNTVVAKNVHLAMLACHVIVLLGDFDGKGTASNVGLVVPNLPPHPLPPIHLSCITAPVNGLTRRARYESISIDCTLFSYSLRLCSFHGFFKTFLPINFTRSSCSPTVSGGQARNAHGPPGNRADLADKMRCTMVLCRDPPNPRNRNPFPAHAPHAPDTFSHRAVFGGIKSPIPMPTRSATLCATQAGNNDRATKALVSKKLRTPSKSYPGCTALRPGLPGASWPSPPRVLNSPSWKSSPYNLPLRVQIEHATPP